MHWTCLDEIGLEYAPAAPDRAGEKLYYPVLVERARDGASLIVDELGKEKSVPIRAECRTLLVDPERHILYDSLQFGIDDGYGRLVGDDTIALLRRTKWELSLVSRGGELLKTIPLARLSKRLPRFFSPTAVGTLLIVFLDRAGSLDLVELDAEGQLLWFLAENTARLGVPGSIELLGNGNLLLADEFYHVAVELERDGTIAWQYGEPKNPSQALDRLSSPKSIQTSVDGTRVIADTRNHRILVIPPGSPNDRAQSLPIHLSSPTYANKLENGNYLVADAGSARVFELDREMAIVWQYGVGLAQRRHFSFPRSVEVYANGTCLVADTANNRVVEVNNGEYKPWETEGAQLFWPRCVRRLDNGSILIADGRSSRIVEVTADGRVAHSLARLDEPWGLLGDPHDVRLLPNHHLLIADAALDLVVEADWQGKVYWAFGSRNGKELSDPHSVQLLGDGTVLVTDTGHHRLVVVDSGGKVVNEIKVLHAGARQFRLNRPRYAEISADGILVIADTGNNRVLAAKWGGELVWEITGIPDSRIPFLDQPRWAHLINPNEVLICDHYHHRIVHLRAGAFA